MKEIVMNKNLTNIWHIQKIMRKRINEL